MATLSSRRFQRAGLLAGFHQVHEQVVEIQRMLGQCLVQRNAAFDVGLDVEDQLLHGRLFVAGADDVEGLHQRDARGQHGGQLAAENRDVAGIDLAAANARGLLLDLAGRDALAAQLGAQRLLVLGQGLALDELAALVLAFPEEGDVALDRPDRRG